MSVITNIFSFLKNPFRKADEAFALQSNDSKLIQNESFWSNVKKQFKKNKLAFFSLRIILLMAIIALFADFIANEKPLVAKINGQTYFPVLKSYAVDMGVSEWQKEFQNIEWKKLEYEWVIFPPIPYLPKNLDDNNIHSVSPLAVQNVPSTRWRHWMGTDELGHDIFAGMIHGTRIALIVGVVSMGIASIIGIMMGAMAGYFGDERLKVSRARLFLNLLFFVFALFYAFGSRGYILKDAIGVSFGIFFKELLISLAIIALFMLTANFFTWVLKFIPFFKKKITIPVDILVSRLIEIKVSIPTMFLIISIVAIAKPSLMIIMAIIGLTSWMGIARFIRAELLRVRNLEYIEAANALGFSEFRIIFRHAIPNAIAPVLITIAFGIASAILIESSLSFLGIGVPAETLTWGSLLAAARQSPTAWWLAIFPGFAIFLTVTLYNLVGEGLTDALDPRLRK
ncbi:MAG: ABC transporter permease [Bacteroidetes bacterium]|nr:ABC transporter permease [Bacteroidota bacterium]